MNASATVASTQMILSWTLLGVLLAWMFFCIFLTLRPRKTRKWEAAELPTPSGAFPAIVSHVPLRPASTPVDIPFGSAHVVPSEAASNVGSTPVA